ncbi:tetratricopeptide repeat protein [Burkholderia sp. GS2Y]|uniref:Tetratricopeptide repeat protein n=1 Tax=Burkholderia theae TaxID=3143496 RepID=A0ABU9WJ69_9BURK
MIKRMFGFRGAASEWIRSADRARDERNWKEAALLYEKAVSIKPGLAGIWVQLGNMRKESRDFEGAEQAYRAAMKLEPAVCDTALQMGHLHKVSGRIDAAVQWYVKALNLDRNNVHARRELGAFDPAMLRSVLANVDDAARAQPIQLVWWDCSAQHAWRVGRAAFSAEAQWFHDLGRAFAGVFEVQPVVFDAASGQFRQYTFDAAASPGALMTAPARGHTAWVTSAFIVPAVSEWVRHLTAVRRHAGMSVIGIVRAHCDTLGPGSAHAPGELDKLRLLARHANVLLTRPGPDRDWLESLVRETSRAQACVATIERTAPTMFPVAGGGRGSGVVVLAPERPSDWHALDAQIDMLKDPAQVCVTGLPDAREACSARGCVAHPPLDSEMAWSRIANGEVDTLLIPEHRVDGEIWAAHALRGGVTVVCHARHRGVFETLGANVRYFPATADASGSAPELTGTDTGEFLLAPWSTLLKRLAADPTDDLRGAESVAQLDYGMFYGFERMSARHRQFSEADGLEMLIGEGWDMTHSFGTFLAGKRASVEFSPTVDMRDDIMCRFVIHEAAPAESGRGWRIVRSFWYTCDAAPKAEGREYAPQRYVVMLDEAQLPARLASERRYAIGGMVAFPRELDHYWHECLDRISRSIHSFKNAVDYRRLD